VVLTAALCAFLVVLSMRLSQQAEARRHYQVPQSTAIESSLGIRITRAAVVGDGGLIELTYTVIDAQKASRFQNDVHHPPVLHDPRASLKNSVYRTALMKQGHSLRPGQTYFILYENNHNSIQPGDTISIDAGGGKLSAVPVR
jgi:hypothetical protein